MFEHQNLEWSTLDKPSTCPLVDQILSSQVPPGNKKIFSIHIHIQMRIFNKINIKIFKQHKCFYIKRFITRSSSYELYELHLMWRLPSSTIKENIEVFKF